MLKVTPALAKAVKRTSLEAVEGGGYDAIVVGAGASGGLAAELLTAAGLKVLVLDAGLRPKLWQAPVTRAVSTTLAALSSPAVVKRLPSSVIWKAERAARMLGRVRQPIQSECYAWPSAPESFVDDKDAPYETPADRPFTWLRVRDLGGRMIVPLHGRQYYRHTPRDFAPLDGLSPAWPFGAEELDPWYGLVEDKLALWGRSEHHPWAPDSRIAHERAPTEAEGVLIERLKARWPAVSPVVGRFAPPRPTMVHAADTGRLLCRTGAVARHIEVENGRATGVAFYDRRARRLATARAPVVFLCAGALESTRILLTSRSGANPEGLGGRSDSLGRHLMDHVSLKLEGSTPVFGAHDVPGAPPGPSICLYLPRFDARESGDPGAARGFGLRIYQSQGVAGASHFVAVTDAEMLPNPENRVTLSSRTDAYGIPVPHISVAHGPHELALAKKQAEALAEIAELAEARLNAPIGGPDTPGKAIHECGMARMGPDPAHSVVDASNECWDARGLYVTDGSCFPSQGVQNPTLTIMALTARACGKVTGRGP